MFLHKAIQEVLRQNSNVPMTIERIASEVNRQQLYKKKDGSEVGPLNIGLRVVSDVAKGNPPLFDVLIRLR